MFSYRHLPCIWDLHARGLQNPNEYVSGSCRHIPHLRKYRSLNTVSFKDICNGMIGQPSNSTKVDKGITNALTLKMQCMKSTTIADVVKHMSSRIRRKTSNTPPPRHPITLPPTLPTDQSWRTLGQRYIVRPAQSSLNIAAPCGSVDKRRCIHHKAMETLTLQELRRTGVIYRARALTNNEQVTPLYASSLSHASPRVL